MKSFNMTRTVELDSCKTKINNNIWNIKKKKKCNDESRRRRWPFSFRGSNWDIETFFPCLRHSLWRKPSPHSVSVLQRFTHADRMFWLGGLLIPRWGQHFTRKVTISIIMMAQRRDTRCDRVQLKRNISYFYFPRHDWGDLMFPCTSFRFPRAEFVIEMAIWKLRKIIMAILGHYLKKKNFNDLKINLCLLSYLTHACGGLLSLQCVSPWSACANAIIAI